MFRFLGLRTWRHTLLLCWTVLWVWYGSPDPSWGQDTHYQNYIMGQRATGMGGAFVAIANDPSAAWYNPAGFATGEGLQVGIGLTLYGLEYRKLKDALFRPEGQSDLERLEFIIFPSTAGVAARFGPRDKTGKPVWGAGFSILMPYRSQIRFRTSFQDTVGTSRREASFILHRDDQTFMAGPTISRRFGPVSIGLSLLYSHRAFGWMLTENDTLSDCEASDLQNCVVNSANSVTSSVEGFVGQFNFRVGLLAQINEKWRFGISASLSSIRLWGDGNFFLQQFSIPRDTDRTPTNNFNRRSQGLKVTSPLPWEVRAGFAVNPNPRLLIALDVVFYAPMKYILVDLGENVDLFQYPREVQRNLLFNVNFGGEYKISPVVPFRWGLYTNLSSAPPIPEISNTPYLPQVHMFGATTSIGLRLWRLSFDLGVSVSYGEGFAQRFRPGTVVAFERVRVRQLFAHFYLAGATEMLGRSLQELWKTVQRSVRKRGGVFPPMRRKLEPAKPKNPTASTSQSGTKKSSESSTPPVRKRPPSTRKSQ